MNAIQVNPKKEKTISKKRHQTITTITTFFFFFTEHKGKQKPYLKENRGCMGFKLKGRKWYMELAFNPV